MENEDWVTGNVVLRINGEPVEMELTVPAKPVKPQRMLPIFQQMSSAVVKLSVDSVEGEGGKISCKAGCGACCRQAVPISEVEAYQIAELVEAMPEPRRSVIKKRFDDALRHFISIRWFDDLTDLQDMAYENVPGFSPAKYTATIMKYMDQGIPCPFLEDEACSIHPDRPLVCREYLVTSPAEHCASPTAETIKKVPIIMRPSKAMLKVGRTKNTEGLSSLMLIEAINFVERHPDEFEEKTGERWAADFFGQLTQTEIPPPEAMPSGRSE
jgi:Fe-S-cluster containining protein